MIGIIHKVFVRDGNKKPGAVIFTDGERLSTWNDKLIDIAKSGIGQLAEYTIEMNGQYENLGSLTLKGAAPAAPASVADRVADSAVAALASTVKDLTAAVRELTSQLARVPRIAPVSVGPVMAAGPVDTLAEPGEPVVDPIADAQEKLGQAINSPEAADAMFAALRAKHKPEKLAEAVKKLLAAHGVE